MANKDDSCDGRKEHTSCISPGEDEDIVEADEEISHKKMLDSPKHVYTSFLREIIDDKAIKFKFILSILVILAFMVLGWTHSQLGPSFPDLVEITNSDLSKGSGFLTSYFSGRLIGSGLSGILSSKMNVYLMFVMSLVLDGAIIAVIPWCVMFEAMVTAHALHGILNGVLNVAVTSTSMSIWGTTLRGRSYVQILYACLAVASALVPLATAPYLRTIESINDSGNLSLPNAGLRNKSDYNRTLIVPNITVIHFSSSIDDGDISGISAPKSTLYIAYSTSAGISFAVAIPFMVLYIRRRSEKSSKSNTDKENQFVGHLPRIVNSLQVCNIGIFAAVYSTSDLLFVSYLTVFCVQHLHWTNASGAILTSVVVFASLASRFIGVFLVRLMKPTFLLLLCTGTYTCGFVCMTITSQLHADIGVWTSVFIIGLPLGIIWPTFLSWINSHLIPVRGKVSGYLLVTSYFGALLCPPLLGYLMQEVSQLWFCYLTVILSAVSVVSSLFMVLHTMHSARNVQ